MSVEVESITVEHYHSPFGIGTGTPRISWSFTGTASNWKQNSYSLRITRDNSHFDEQEIQVASEQSLLVTWPFKPLRSRECVKLSVLVRGSSESGTSTSKWKSCNIEAGLLSRCDWKANLIGGEEQPLEEDKKPIRFIKSFTLESLPKCSRLYITSHGIYHVTLNGKRVGNQYLTPGWQSYKHHLNYQVYDLNETVRTGENRVEIEVGEGWYAGRLGRPGTRNNFGSRLGVLAQLELDGGIIGTDDTWMCSGSSTLASTIYDGETWDSAWSGDAVTTLPVTVLPFPEAQLVASETPPIHAIMTLKAQKIITSRSGKKVLDFGQNIAGWVRIEREVFHSNANTLILRFAEVMENGELGVRPLRTAKCTDTILLGGNTKGWEPKFTWHGFRYVEPIGVDFDIEDFTAVVISSDMHRIGDFSSSHEMANQLHRNVVWSTIGNFISVPMDCPQRDERLGWTGDLQVYAPTAGYLFDTTGFLSSWLRDVAAEQCIDFEGVVPELVPFVPMFDNKPRRYAVWGDVSILTPWVLYKASGDKRILERQWTSMVAWLRTGVERQANGLWKESDKQFGDWLDVKAPPTYPAHGMTDPLLVANAYLVHVTDIISQIAEILDRPLKAQLYRMEYEKLKAAFRREYVTASGRLVSDSQTGFALALHFNLLEGEEVDRAVERLVWLIRWDSFKITTGFAGTPILLPTLARCGRLDLAYRMLQEKDCPSWLYPVSMGATTIWERWDSMRPDGSINPGQMTSFNHYALGSVAQFLHETIGGLSALEPGWKTALISPRPGGTFTSASTSHKSPFGTFAVDWVLHTETGKMDVKCTVPPNAEARVILPELDVKVGSGSHVFSVMWTVDTNWPPRQLKGPTKIHMPDNFVP